MKTVGAVACDDVEVLRAEMHAYSIVAADGRRIIESIVSDADQGSASSVDPRVAEARGGIRLFFYVFTRISYRPPRGFATGQQGRWFGEPQKHSLFVLGAPPSRR